MASTSQHSFSKGVISPNLWARCDLQLYTSALRECKNFLISKQGTADYRPGTEFVAAVADSSKRVSLRKFVFNNSPANVLVLEFGEGYIRFYQNGAQVQSGGFPLSVVTTYTESEVGELQIVQQGDVLFIVHPSHPPAALARLAPTTWALVDIDFNPAIWGPNNVVVTGGAAAAGLVFFYAVTSVDENGVESPAISQPPHPPFTASYGFMAANTQPTAAAPGLVVWDAVVDAVSYNVYRSPLDTGENSLGYIGNSLTNAFSDPGITADPLTQPPLSRLPFDSATNYPSVAGFYQQRLVLANTTTDPSTVWTSRVGDYPNFRLSIPLQDDDPVTFVLASNTIDEVEHVVDLGTLIVLTQGSEWFCNGDMNGTLTPTSINALIGSTNGSSNLRPIKVDGALLYVGTLGTAIRELLTDMQNGAIRFTGADLTVTATHLFNGYTVTDWDWQQVPTMIAWMVRSDGELLGLTYIKEQQMLAWHHHDTMGTFENVFVVPEGSEHRVYVVVKRTINGQTVRYIERFRSPVVLDVVADSVFLDSALSYDGRDYGTTSGTTLTLTGSGWTTNDPLTLTASAAEFVAADATDGNARVLRDAAGDEVTVVITGFTSDTVVTVIPRSDVPVGLQAVVVTDWDRALRVVTGLSSLEGEDVGVFADGYVVASPNDPDATVITVAAGKIDLGGPYALIRVGLPYLGDFETLDIDTPGGSTLKESKQNVTRVGVFLNASRGVWSGQDFPTGTDATENLRQLKMRQNESPSDPINPLTGYVYVDIPTNWKSSGSFVIRQVDCVPLSILAVFPEGYVG